jgi:hypothetical protein
MVIYGCLLSTFGVENLAWIALDCSAENGEGGFSR